MENILEIKCLGAKATIDAFLRGDETKKLKKLNNFILYGNH